MWAKIVFTCIDINGGHICITAILFSFSGVRNKFVRKSSDCPSFPAFLINRRVILSTWTKCLIGETKPKDGLGESPEFVLSTNRCSVHGASRELLQNRPRSECVWMLLCSTKTFALQFWSCCTTFLANISTDIFLAVIFPGQHYIETGLYTPSVCM